MARCIQSSAVTIFCFEEWSENLLLIFITDPDAMVNDAYLHFYKSRFDLGVIALYFNITVFG